MIEQIIGTNRTYPSVACNMGLVSGIVKGNYDEKQPGKVKVEYSLGEQGKMLTERIAYFLDTGKVKYTSEKRRTTNVISEITEETIIESDIVCSEIHRVFFLDKIGKSFSFNVMFQKWLKANAGKTYRDAIDAYYQIIEEKKKGKRIKSFKRDYFNQGCTIVEIKEDL